MSNVFKFLFIIILWIIFFFTSLVFFNEIGEWYSAKDLLNSGKLQPGDIIYVNYTTFFHEVIYEKDGYVLHYSKEKPVVERADLVSYAKENLVKIGNVAVDNFAKNQYNLLPKPPNEIIKTAQALIGHKSAYNLLCNNCEMFVSFCRYGERFSYQVTTQNMVNEAFNSKYTK